MDKTIKLDARDNKLLSYLYHHYREPLTKIAKACKISRDQVEYRLGKYESQGLIRKYLTMFNYNLLGYNDFIIVWLKLQGTSEEKQAIKNKLENMKNAVSVGNVLVNYDLFVNFVFKNKSEFEELFHSFLEEHKEHIKEYVIFITTYTEFYPLKIIGLHNEEKNYPVVAPTEKVELSEKDLAILKMLEKNGRARVIDIAEKTRLSSELVVYKLKQLYKNKIILGTRIQFDMEAMGFYFGSLIIKLKDRSKKTKEKIINFCKNHKHINALSFGIAEYDCVIQAFYQQEEEFRQTLRDIKEKFREEIDKSFILLIENEGRAKTLPY
jgi:DNA-binding Lrp family transcriptional regulator